MEKILVYVMAIWSILHQCGICYGHLVFFFIWYTFPLIGMLHQEKRFWSRFSLCSILCTSPGGEKATFRSKTFFRKTVTNVKSKLKIVSKIMTT
jgi:hypothetical protein